MLSSECFHEYHPSYAGMRCIECGHVIGWLKAHGYHDGWKSDFTCRYMSFWSDEELSFAEHALGLMEGMHDGQELLEWEWVRRGWDGPGGERPVLSSSIWEEGEEEVQEEVVVQERVL